MEKKIGENNRTINNDAPRARAVHAYTGTDDNSIGAATMITKFLHLRLLYRLLGRAFLGIGVKAA